MSSAGDPVTLDALLTLRQPLDAQISRDGERVAVVASETTTASGSLVPSTIWAGRRDGPVAAVTSGPGSDRHPRFSPDGRTLAFASDREHPGRCSPYLLASDGEVRGVGDVAGDVEDIQWADDGRSLVVLAADPGSERAGVDSATTIREAGEPEQDPRVERPSDARRRLLAIELDSGATAAIELPGLTVWEFSLSARGIVAVVSSDPTESGWYESWIVSIDPGDGTVTRLYAPPEPELQIECPRLSPDGRRLAFIQNVCSDRGETSGPVWLLELDAGEARCLTPALDVTKLAWVGAERLRVCGPRGLEAHCGFVDLAGRVEEAWSGPARLGTGHQVNAASDAAGRWFAAVREAPGEPPELAVLDAAAPDAVWRTATDANAQLRALRTPQMRRIAWTSEGHEVEGLLVLPEEPGPSPLIVHIHGGPTTNWEWAFSPGYWGAALLFAEAGYAVLLPNPRGSAGRGPAFARANVGDLGGADFRDVLAGVEECVASGVADSERVGIWGISAGGLMTSWAVGNSDRFAAAVTVACISDWVSFHNTTNVPRFDVQFLQSDPYDPQGDYVPRSPVAHAHRATTPTLVLHGEEDRITPVGQGVEMYRALVDAGCETELVLYPREGHPRMTGFAERAHARDATERLLAWMDDHLGRGNGGPQ